MYKLTQERRKYNQGQTHDVISKDQSKHMIAISDDHLVRKLDVERKRWNTINIVHG